MVDCQYTLWECKVFTGVKHYRHFNGGGWVAETARVADTAFVGPDARVYGNARVTEDAWVSGNALVTGNAQVSGTARVYDKIITTGETT